MNLILLDPEKTLRNNQYTLSPRQREHIECVVKAKAGDTLRVGLLNGGIGEGVYQPGVGEGDASISNFKALMPPPEALPLTLIMALPRPNMLKRTLQNVTAMGVKEIHLIHSAKVEKSYWQSPVLRDTSIRQYLLEGLEQAKDTVIPQVYYQRQFRAFVEDSVPSLLSGRRGLLAHPYNAQPCPVAIKEPCVLALGPEGGWNDFEVEKWIASGMESVHIGERILRVETVVPVLLSRLYPAGL